MYAEGDLEPQEDYANYDPDNTAEEGSTVTKNGHSITDSLRHALEQRNRVNQSQGIPQAACCSPYGAVAALNPLFLIDQSVPLGPLWAFSACFFFPLNTMQSVLHTCK